MKASQARLRELVAWRDERNVYRVLEEYLSLYSGLAPQQIAPGLKGLSEWRAFWEVQDTSSQEGWPLYRRGNRDISQPAELRVEDFRLQEGARPGRRR